MGVCDVVIFYRYFLKKILVGIEKCKSKCFNMTGRLILYTSLIFLYSGLIVLLNNTIGMLFIFTTSNLS